MISTALLLLFILLPFPVWGFRKHLIPCKGKAGMPIIVITTILLQVVLYIGAISSVGAEYESDVRKYDLNHNGELSPAERNPEAEAARKLLTHDTGRSLAPLFALPLAIIWTGGIFSMAAFVPLLAATIRDANHPDKGTG